MVAPRPRSRVARANPRAECHTLYRLRVDIAVVVNGGMAETLQATPLLRTLRAGYPTARITLICPSTAVGAGAPHTRPRRRAAPGRDRPGCRLRREQRACDGHRLGPRALGAPRQ